MRTQSGQGVRKLAAFAYQRREGLGCLRLCMVVAGFAPLFILVGIRGVEAIPDRWVWAVCICLVVVPYLVVFLRLFSVWRHEPLRPIVVGQVEESRSHIVTYLFVTLLPFYRQDLGDVRDLIAIVVAVVFIIFLFWHLNLHYVNILLAIFGYRVYTVRPRDDDANPYTGHVPIVVITRKGSLAPGRNITGYRLSDSLYWSRDR